MYGNTIENCKRFKRCAGEVSRWMERIVHTWTLANNSCSCSVFKLFFALLKNCVSIFVFCFFHLFHFEMVIIFASIALDRFFLFSICYIIQHIAAHRHAKLLKISLTILTLFREFLFGYSLYLFFVLPDFSTWNAVALKLIAFATDVIQTPTNNK